MTRTVPDRIRELQSLFAAQLVRYHVATPDMPLPPRQPGITWIWAANGIFKRGTDAEHDILIRVSDTAPVPGLAQLLPSVRTRGHRGQLPAAFLASVLAHARQAANVVRGVSMPIEQQYHITLEQGRLRVRVPVQAATPGHVMYMMPTGTVLCDLHSHHHMPAYFSATDDCDDTGLSVSAVIGRIFSDEPEIVCRLNCYGHRQQVSARLIFDDLGPFREGGSDAITC